MNRTLSILLCLAAGVSTLSALDFEGAADEVISIVPDKSTGLEQVYVVRDASGVRVSYPSATARWSRFGASGGAYAEPLESTVASGSSSVSLPAGDCGLMVEDAGRQYCYWIVDYAAHAMRLDGVTASGGDYACERTLLTIAGYAPAINYYSINGREILLSRDIEVSYQTLVYDEEAMQFIQAERRTTLGYVSASNYVDAPLCNTTFTVTGDRFLQRWGNEESVTSADYTAVAVDAHTSATQAERDVANEQKPSGAGSLGGSAPCEVSFEAVVSDAAVFREWQISHTPEFEIPDNTFNDTAFDYTFNENGTYYVRFTAANADGTCTYTGETYEISIGESKLVCPNAFTPDSSPGVNDEWRVSYQSIVEFKCDIFNRWGAKIISLDHPSQGWDGTYRGKKVGPGVYYYVIRARGADGRDYNLSGDINIVGSRQATGAHTPSEE
ncbi:MAG: gliding motility-associated C-terminal domain-containing protein [Muribaculaceae bacterium]|nr:gliding motility-associated C-terminal domain-containing protein [Muribaculaceae bacterium]